MNLVKSAALQLDPINETQKLLSTLSGQNSKAGEDQQDSFPALP